MPGSGDLPFGELPLGQLPAAGSSLLELVHGCTRIGASAAALSAAAAESVAARLGASFVDTSRSSRSGEAFSLFAALDVVDISSPAFGAVVSAFGESSDAVELGVALPGRVYELALRPDTRRKQGAHFTAASLATRLAAVAVEGWDEPDDTVILDPCCGGGAFLLGALNALESANPRRPRSERAQRVAGRDIDPDALAVTEATIALWVAETTSTLEPLGDFGVADAALDPLPKADLIVGNPPFLNQLAADTSRDDSRRQQIRERFGSAVGAYTDEAAVILLAALPCLRAGGRLVLIQPLSLLAARDAAGAREQAVSGPGLRGLWVCPEHVFDAAVAVCAPVLGAGADRLLRWRGPAVAAADPVARPGPAATWSRVGADLAGVPRVELRLPADHATVRDVATVTAGFRDQFYGFVPYVHEADPTGAAATEDLPTQRVVTVGMIDTLRNRWGSGSFAFAGKRFTRPVLSLTAVAAEDPSLGAWTAARTKPKVLVATQTKVIEAVVDEAGRAVPITPVISVEPHEAAQEVDVWYLAALLSAPVLSALAHTEQFGSALSVAALKVSATFVGSLPLPTNRDRWAEGATLARRASEAAAAGRPEVWAETLRALGRVMNDAWSTGAGSSASPSSTDDELFDWWENRLPPWR